MATQLVSDDLWCLVEPLLPLHPPRPKGGLPHSGSCLPNIADADVLVGSPLKHMDPNGDGDFADQDRLYEYATCHGYFSA